VQHVSAQHGHARLVDRSADSCPPRKCNLLWRQRRVAQYRCERVWQKLLNGNHQTVDPIRSILKLKSSHSPTLILASASPRRAELLRAAGIAFEIHPAHVDEDVHDGESPEAYVLRLAEEKGSAVHSRVPDRVVLAADTTVVVDGQILGKPNDDDDARRMLRLLRGRAHEVLSGICLICPREAGRDGHTRGTYDVRLARTSVEFAPLTDEEIGWYAASGEPMDKAGAYAIQGLASRFVTRIDGSYSNVVGLPVALVYEMLSSHGR
jgi:septum formation protein